MDIKKELERKVRTRLCECGVRKVVAAVSGGADSVALLRLLLACGCEVVVVHCNFHLRGQESMRDERFVEDLCRRFRLRFHKADVDVDTYRKAYKCSVETACRELRYTIFRETMEDTHADRIAVAHNADDQAETLLLNLFRGAGVRGLGGMLFDTGEIIRPLLDVSRHDIILYLDEIGERFITDSTNLECDFRRNYIRNRLLPSIEDRWPGVKRVLARTASHMQEEERMLRQLEKDLIGDETTTLFYSVLRTSPSSRWLIHRFASRFGASPTICLEMESVVNSPEFVSGKLWRLPEGSIVAERDALVFYPHNALDASHGAEGENPFSVEFVSAPANHYAFMKQIENCDLFEFWGEIPSDFLEFRHPQEGDRIEPLGMEGSQLVSKIMKDAKYSLEQKCRQWVVADSRNGKILWLPGLKRSRHCLVTGKMHTIVHLVMNRG